MVLRVGVKIGFELLVSLPQISFTLECIKRKAGELLPGPA